MIDRETTEKRAVREGIDRLEQLSTVLGDMLTRIREDVACGRIIEGSTEHRDAFAAWAANVLEAEAARRELALAGGVFDADVLSLEIH